MAKLKMIALKLDLVIRGMGKYTIPMAISIINLVIMILVFSIQICTTVNNDISSCSQIVVAEM